MRRKLLRTYCMFVTLVSFYFYSTKFEPNLDMEMKAFTTFFLVQESNIEAAPRWGALGCKH